MPSRINPRSLVMAVYAMTAPQRAKNATTPTMTHALGLYGYSIVVIALLRRRFPGRGDSGAAPPR
jgi:hypothetical protein